MEELRDEIEEFVKRDFCRQAEELVAEIEDSSDYMWALGVFMKSNIEDVAELVDRMENVLEKVPDERRAALRDLVDGIMWDLRSLP